MDRASLEREWEKEKSEKSTALGILFLLLSPVLIPAALVLAIPVALLGNLVQRHCEKRLGRRLAERGRFMEWADVDARLTRGEGTLIIEWLTPKGLIRTWWTECDVAGGSPVALLSDTDANAKREQNSLRLLEHYAESCVARLTDIESGTANWTVIQVPEDRRRTFSKYPAGKVVTFIRYWDPPDLISGDATDFDKVDGEPPMGRVEA